MKKREVIRIAGSYYVNIPKEVMKQTGEKQVLISISNGGNKARVYEVRAGLNVLKELGAKRARGLLDWDLKL